MNWDDVIERLQLAQLQPIEETYMEHYGKLLAAHRAKFEGRTIRCTYGRLSCGSVSIEIFLFPSKGQLEDFLELMEENPWRMVHDNVALHFPICDPDFVEKVLAALQTKQA